MRLLLVILPSLFYAATKPPLILSRRDGHQCPLGQFPCGNLSVCLPQALHCNGEDDCDNGADEENCVDDSGWLQILGDMLAARSGRMAVEDEGDTCWLELFPERCRCWGRAVDCTEQDLATVPWVSSNVTRMQVRWKPPPGFWAVTGSCGPRYSHGPVSLCRGGTASDSKRDPAAGRTPTAMQLTLCRLRTHQWCFILFNVLLFHVLLFGADLLEEYFLRSLPLSYTDAKALEIRERAGKLDTDLLKANLSHTVSSAATCSDREIFLLVLVCSSPENRTRRNLIRQTWGNVTDASGHAVLTLFALGKAASVTTQLEINEESQKHRDIIEGSFIDSPETQTQKMVMSVEWTVTFCPQARYILKADEDLFVGIPSLAGYLLSLAQLEDIYIGRVVHQAVPDRDPRSPGFVPIHQYAEEFYPDYCQGSAFLMSQDVARKVYVAAKEVPVSVPPDIFVGICARRAGITPIHSSRFSGEKHISYNRCCYKFIFTSSNMKEDELFKDWKETSDGKDCSLLETYYGLVSCKVLTYIGKFKQFNFDRIKNEVLHFAY